MGSSGMGSSGIDLVGFEVRLSYARWRNHCSDSNSNRIMASRGPFRKLFGRIISCLAYRTKNTFGVSLDYDLGNA
jgi:hypothetical protein